MKLIIAEKPSLAKNVVNAIKGSKINHEGYSEKGDYLVSYAFGHLFALYDIEEYTKKEKSVWNMEELPFFPEKFYFTLKKDIKTKKVDEGIKKQYKLLCELMNRSDIDTIIHCGDSDREGEVIVRLIIKNGLKESKPILRLWLPEQSEQGIQEGLRHLIPDAQKDALFQEGLARTYIDWLYGINLTRLLSIKAGQILRGGRVLLPIVNAIYQREMEIRTFTPNKFWKVESKEYTNGELINVI